MHETRRTLQVPWRERLLAAHEDPSPARELTLVTLHADDGSVGYGELATLPGYDGSFTEAAERAAIDIAQWDLRGRREGLPVWRLLGGESAQAVSVNATIGAQHPDLAAAQARAAVSAGFTTIKVKVGVGDDLARVRAVRSGAGREVRIRLDANGAWTVEQAAEMLRRLGELGIESCEEPVHGADALAQVARMVPEIPIAADESAAEALAAGVRICAAVCLKVARGGLTSLLADARQARSHGYDVYLASTLDGPLGIAAALHAAAVIRPDRACGLATLDRFDRPNPIPARQGRMSPPSGVGLGDGLLAFYDG